MDELFKDATQFNAPLASWDVSGVSSMKGMFEGASSFDQDISSWDVSMVSDMDMMFKEASSFDKDIVGQQNSAWNIKSVTTMKKMFYGASSFSKTLSCGQWDTARDSLDIDTTDMFVGAGTDAWFGALAGYNASVDMAIISDHIRLMRNKGQDERTYQVVKQPLLQKQLPTKLEGCQAHHVGSTVATSADGRILAVGGYETDNNGCWQTDDVGVVFVYRLESDDIWRKMGKLVPGAECDHKFGFSIDVSGDGKFIAVGSPYCDENATGAAHLFVFDGDMDSIDEEHRSASSPLLDIAATSRANRWTRYEHHQLGNAMGDQFGYAVSIANNFDGRKVKSGDLTGNDIAVYWSASAPAAENTDKSYFMIRAYPESTHNDNKKLHRRFFDASDATLVGGQSISLKSPSDGFYFASTLWEDKTSVNGTKGYKTIVYKMSGANATDDFDVSVVDASSDGRIDWPLGTSEMPDVNSTDNVEKMGLVDMSVDLSLDGRTIAIGYGGQHGAFTAGDAYGAVRVFRKGIQSYVARGNAITGSFPVGGKNRVSLTSDGNTVMVAAGRSRPMTKQPDAAIAFGFGQNSADWRSPVQIYQYSKGAWLATYDQIFHPTDTLEGNAVTDMGSPTIIEGQLTETDRQIAASTITDQANA
eukprot:g167.t1